MTNEEFFTTLKQVARKHPFHVTPAGLLRTVDNDLCPLCAVARKVFKKKFMDCHYALASDSLLLQDYFGVEIMNVADTYTTTIYYPEIRRQLKESCFPTQEV